jgi:hypothetical protein
VLAVFDIFLCGVYFKVNTDIAALGAGPCLMHTASLVKCNGTMVSYVHPDTPDILAPGWLTESIARRHAADSAAARGSGELALDYA